MFNARRGPIVLARCQRPRHPDQNKWPLAHSADYAARERGRQSRWAAAHKLSRYVDVATARASCLAVIKPQGASVIDCP